MGLAQIMVAPNGAHKTKEDHPRLPVTIDEIVKTTIACREAGADGLHAHVRDDAGCHVLDAGLYRELLAEIERQMPGFFVQITTEAVGRYSPQEQAGIVRGVEPASVSVALREMLVRDDDEFALRFYQWAQEAEIKVQHILYEAEELVRLRQMAGRCNIRAEGLQVLFVLGRYTRNQQSAPGDLDPYLDTLADQFGRENGVDWAVCAFGAKESDCLIYANSRGGKVRVGFENNLLMRNGDIAKDNAARVREVAEGIGCKNLKI